MAGYQIIIILIDIVNGTVDNKAFLMDNSVSYFFLLGYKKNLVKDLFKLVGGNVIHFTATIET